MYEPDGEVGSGFRRTRTFVPRVGGGLCGRPSVVIAFRDMLDWCVIGCDRRGEMGGLIEVREGL